MTEQQYISIAPAALLEKAGEMKTEGFILSQVSATGKDGYDLLYSFEKAYAMTHLRLAVAEDEEIDSISGLYPYAFLYENELKDLFGIKIKNINLDFQGNFYKLAKKTPFRANVVEKAAK